MARTNIFTRLKKLFSDDIVIHNIGGGNIKVFDFNKLQDIGEYPRPRTTHNGLYTYGSRFQQNTALQQIYPSQRLNYFRDYENMDKDPIISAALDIFSDECLGANTIIPLLDGRKPTIKELYDTNETNFWVYSLSSDGSFFPNKCEYVKYNGKKKMYRLTFEDETCVEASENHLWVKDDGNLIKTSNIKSGTGIKTLLYEKDNHKIINIEYIGEKDAYDLVNVGDSHIYAVELKDGGKAFCHNCTVKDEVGQILNIKCEEKKVREELRNLFYNVLNIEFTLWPLVRSLCKYGDAFYQLFIDKSHGIYNFKPLSAYEVTREEGYDQDNPSAVRFRVEGVSGRGTLENFQVAHFRILADTNFLPYGRCLTKDSYIETEFGVKQINNIHKGDRVWTFNLEKQEFELSDVLNSISSGKKKILKITTQHNEIKCSENHPILTYDPSDKFVYKRADELNVKDLLVLSSNNFIKERNVEIKHEFLTEGNKNGWKNNLHLVPKNVDKKFARLFGFLLGDGFLTHKYGEIIGVAFARGVRKEVNDFYVDILEKLSGKKCSHYRKTRDDREYEQTVCHSKMLGEILRVNGFDGSCYTKRLPSWIYDCSEELQLEFIKGLVDSDGSVFNDKWNVNRYSIELSNKELVDDIKILLRRLNIKVSNSNSRRENSSVEIGGEFYKRRGSYYIYFYLDSPRINGFTKYNFCENHNIVLYPVKSISVLEEQETFDIQVEKNNNFISNGIIVHNSMIEPVRKAYKQLTLMEDAMMIHRIMRAPERRIFRIDIGNISPNEVDAYMQKIISQIKKIPYIDKNTGEYNLKYNLLNMNEDFYLPVRGGDSGTNIEALPGLQYEVIDDIEYLKNKMMAGLKIPKAFLGFEEALGSKSTLSAEDVRFSRTIETIQKVVVSELIKIAVIHLYTKGFKEEDMDFRLRLTNPSIIYEQERLELWGQKVNLARDAKETKKLSSRWIYSNIFNMSDEEMEEEENNVIEDAKREYRLMQIEQDGNDPAKSGKHFDSDGNEDEERDSNVDFDDDLSKDDFEEEGTEGSHRNGHYRRNGKLRTRRKDDAFGEDPLGKRDIENIKRLDNSINSEDGDFSDKVLISSTIQNLRKFKLHNEKKKMLSEKDTTNNGDFFLDDKKIIKNIDELVDKTNLNNE